MKLTVIDTGFFKLDGGAMFGVVPKIMWSKLEVPDENNFCTWAMRCLLVEVGNRKILIDAGLGNKQSEKFFSHYSPHGNDTLLNSLAKNGLKPSDITDVFLTHLHFDHVGGAVSTDANGKYVPTFPNAKYWCNKAHYDWAYTPNDREKASFLKENFVPLMEHGVMSMVDSMPYDQLLDWMPEIKIGFAYGHTEALMTPYISYKGKTVIYCADLLPSPSHISMPFIMAYDVRPLQTLKEKEWFLTNAAEQGHILFFEHAPIIEACTVKVDEKGRIVADKQGALADFV